VGRRAIYADDRDREHFMDLLEELVGRYGVHVHAYVLMQNHYHLLIETPHGNASRALQWLNVSYAAWYNTRHQRGGQLFQGRYKSIPIEQEGSWALTCSIYLHLNPVRIRSLGLGKADRAAERAGAMPAAPERGVIIRRLAVLRNHHWSSYRAYAGYARAPKWLTRETLWQRVAQKAEDAPEAYRREIEAYLKQGIQEGTATRLTQAVALGSTAFLEKLRLKLAGQGTTRANSRAWRRLLPFAAVVREVEGVRGCGWAEMTARRGDWGRDLALYIGRMQGGMTLTELAAQSGIPLDTVQSCVQRMRRRLPEDATLRRHHARTAESLTRMAEA
jgi:REP element-mobilizing transposase RayT